jgi:hypothetical protein
MLFAITISSTAPHGPTHGRALRLSTAGFANIEASFANIEEIQLKTSRISSVGSV